MARSELRLTMQVEYIGEHGDLVPIIREQADCHDLFALCYEIDGPNLTGERFKAAISEAFLSGTREIKQPTAG